MSLQEEVHSTALHVLQEWRGQAQHSVRRAKQGKAPQRRPASATTARRAFSAKRADNAPFALTAKAVLSVAQLAVFVFLVLTVS